MLRRVAERIYQLTHSSQRAQKCRVLQPLLFAPRPLAPSRFTKSMQNSKLGVGVVGGGWGGRELPTPTVLATCLENIQIACVICKPLSHPGGSYISCHYPGGPPIIVSCNNQLQCFIPQARQARSAFFFFFFLRCTLPHYFSLTKE